MARPKLTQSFVCMITLMMYLTSQATCMSVEKPGAGHKVKRDEQQIQPGYLPYQTKNSLGQPVDNAYQYCSLTPLTIDNAEYEKRCGSKSDSKWPCFTHYDSYLGYVNVQPWFEPLNMSEEIIVKDERGVDFTMRNASIAFEITYQNDGTVKFKYSNYDPETGCYDVDLTGSDRNPKDYRIWASDDEGKDRDIDTLHSTRTGKRFCTKWGHIWTGRKPEW
ncbi:related to Mig1 protein [Ustilago trichophora]|uniref:Related to Mig1 protein n=1 Tax=Ustilago trichophora TaxID=86804 RepID=A0A5C3E8M3_9BASI|nr:related to Mig1 protein [Ustilago trichophora]